MKIYSTFLNKEVDVAVMERDGAKIIFHNEIEKLADENDVSCTYETVDFKGLVAVVKCIATATTENGKVKRIEAFGESNDKNLENAIAQKYPFIMAAKRAYDRAVLRCLGLYGFYSDCEIDIDKKASGTKKSSVSEPKANETGLASEFQLPSQKKGKQVKKAVRDDKRPLTIDDVPQEMLEEVGNALVESEGVTAEINETVNSTYKETVVETATEETNNQPAEASTTVAEVKSDETVEAETMTSETANENTFDGLDGATVVEEYESEEYANYTDADFADDSQISDGFDALDLSDDEYEYDMSELDKAETTEEAEAPSEADTADGVSDASEEMASAEETSSEETTSEEVSEYTSSDNAETALVEEAEFFANPTSVEEKVYEENPEPEDPFEDTSFLNVVLTCGKFVGKNMTTFDAYKDTKMRASLVWVATNTLPNKAAEAQKKAAIDTIAYLEKHPELLSA